MSEKRVRKPAGLLFALMFYGGSVPIAIGIAMGGLISHAWLRRGSRIWAGWFLWCARIFLGIRMEVRGAVPQSRMVVAFKHQSMFETIAVLALFVRPAVVMKAELRKIPLWGWLSERHGSIYVERDGGGKTLRKMLRMAKERAVDDRPIVIFPEGTRVPYGQTAPIRAGLYALASGTRLPVVPVALDAGRIWTREPGKRPGTITFAFQPEIASDMPREEFEARVLAAINADPRTVAVREGAGG